MLSNGLFPFSISTIWKCVCVYFSHIFSTLFHPRIFEIEKKRISLFSIVIVHVLMYTRGVQVEKNTVSIEYCGV